MYLTDAKASLTITQLPAHNAGATKGKTMKVFGVVIAALAVFLALIWVFQGNDFFLYRAFAPKYEQVRRETFEQTKSYKQGTIQELQNMQFEYIKSDKAHQDALADIILRRAADFGDENLPTDLRSFVQKLRNERLEAR